MSFLDFQIEPTSKNLLKWSFLRLLSLIFGGLVRIRLALYRVRLKKGWSADKPVISVGNITIGGTGKTPMVDWFLTFLLEKGLKPAVLTRGYKSKGSEKHQVLNTETVSAGSCLQFGDEPWLLFHNHPEVSIFISPDRIESARRAQHKADILILDDGMQHVQLERNLEIVMIDSISGLGNGHLIPLGPLREPLSRLSRADIVIFTKSNLSSPEGLREQISAYLRPGTPQFYSRYEPDRLLSSDGSTSLAPDSLRNSRCRLFSGIGNPAGFSKTIEGLDAKIQNHLIFDDHQTYSSEIRDRIRRFSEVEPYDYLICTEKDWVKLEAFREELPVIHRLKMKIGIDPGFISFVSEWLESNGRV